MRYTFDEVLVLKAKTIQILSPAVIGFHRAVASVHPERDLVLLPQPIYLNNSFQTVFKPQLGYGDIFGGPIQAQAPSMGIQGIQGAQVPSNKAQVFETMEEKHSLFFVSQALAGGGNFEVEK